MRQQTEMRVITDPPLEM